MLFNSFEYLIFLPTVFLVYWLVFNKQLTLQNLLLLIVSYVFYGWWDWRFLTLIAFSSLIDYNIGLQLGQTSNNKRRKLLLYTSVAVNLGLLGYFKYYNFFIDNFKLAFESIGIHMELSSLQLVLPVGISFYTFQTLGYTIDVYKNRIQPTKNAIQFFAFVSFFPQLVAGPIERAKNLLPQFNQKRQFSYDLAADGMRQILFGLFKKMVIADNCAIYVNQIFEAPQDYSSGTLVLGAILFSCQIYGDFAGYSDIAIGTAKLFGFNLMQNFATPYLSRDIAEFWRRWHISLTTWFRDYVFLPLSRRKTGPFINIRNVFIVFLITGLWHGANWTFIMWGLLNAILVLPVFMMKRRNKRHIGKVVGAYKNYPSFKEVLQIATTFLLVSITAIFFRSPNLKHGLEYIKHMVSIKPGEIIIPTSLLGLLLFLVVLEWFGRKQPHTLQNVKILPRFIRYSFYILMLFLIILFMPNEANSFIYFQF